MNVSATREQYGDLQEKKREVTTGSSTATQSLGDSSEPSGSEAKEIAVTSTEVTSYSKPGLRAPSSILATDGPSAKTPVTLSMPQNPRPEKRKRVTREEHRVTKTPGECGTTAAGQGATVMLGDGRSSHCFEQRLCTTLVRHSRDSRVALHYVPCEESHCEKLGSKEARNARKKGSKECLCVLCSVVTACAAVCRTLVFRGRGSTGCHAWLQTLQFAPSLRTNSGPGTRTTSWALTPWDNEYCSPMMCHFVFQPHCRALCQVHARVRRSSALPGLVFKAGASGLGHPVTCQTANYTAPPQEEKKRPRRCELAVSHPLCPRVITT